MSDAAFTNENVTLGDPDNLYRNKTSQGVEMNNEEAQAAVQRVRDLHKPCENCDYHVFDHCVSCCRLWPCPTIKALDDEQ